MLSQIEIYFENETLKVGYHGLMGYYSRYPEYMIDGPLEIIRDKLIKNSFTDLYKVISSDDHSCGIPCSKLNLKEGEFSKLFDLINSVDSSYTRRP